MKSIPPVLDPSLANDAIARAQRDLDTLTYAYELRRRLRRMVLRGQLSGPLETTLFEREEDLLDVPEEP